MTILIETDWECHLDDIRMQQLLSTVVSGVRDGLLSYLFHCAIMAHTKVLFLAALRLHPEILCLYIVVKIVSRKRLKFICIAVTCIP